MSEDWDNLILLDAARFDVFASINDIEGELDYRISTGSSSSEWFKSNFVGDTYHDSVYISGNAPAMNLMEDQDPLFHAFYPVRIRPINEVDELGRERGIDPRFPDDSSAVLPEDVVTESLRAHEMHPQKRLIIHFMQPHLPYIGSKGYEIFEMIGDDDSFQLEGRWGTSSLKVFKAARTEKYDITNTDIRDAYRENLEIVLEYAKDLIEKLDGKTVISSDHGEMLGEHVPLIGEQYSHPNGLATEKLRKVPWLAVDDERRPVVESDPIVTDRPDEKEIEDQLRALGYK
jgi:hypothetical protein